MLSKLEAIQVKVDEVNAAQLRPKEEADDLRSELIASKALISDINKKNSAHSKYIKKLHVG